MLLSMQFAQALTNAAAHISPIASLPDGSQVEIADHYFLADQWLTLTIAGSDESVIWEHSAQGGSRDTQAWLHHG